MNSSEDAVTRLQQTGLRQTQEDPDGESPFPPGCLAALMLLMDARNYARALGCSLWDFAVEIQELRALGLTNTEFRWLVCRGFVEHRTEVTRTSAPARTFEESGRLTFSDKTGFVLNDAGLELLRTTTARSSELGATAACTQSQENASPSDKLIPKWDRERRELRVGNVVVKQFKSPAPNQQMILAAFEEEGWPAHIFDPLPQDTDQDPKRRLHDTINSLNNSHKQQLVRFTGDGNGEGVCWQLLRPDSDGGESGGSSF